MTDESIQESFSELVEALNGFAHRFEEHVEEPESEEQRRRLVQEVGFLRSVLTDIKNRHA